MALYCRQPVAGGIMFPGYRSACPKNFFKSGESTEGKRSLWTQKAHLCPCESNISQTPSKMFLQILVQTFNWSCRLRSGGQRLKSRSQWPHKQVFVLSTMISQVHRLKDLKISRVKGQIIQSWRHAMCLSPESVFCQRFIRISKHWKHTLTIRSLTAGIGHSFQHFIGFSPVEIIYRAQTGGSGSSHPVTQSVWLSASCDKVNVNELYWCGRTVYKHWQSVKWTLNFDNNNTQVSARAQTLFQVRDRSLT